VQVKDELIAVGGMSFEKKERFEPRKTQRWLRPQPSRKYEEDGKSGVQLGLDKRGQVGVSVDSVVDIIGELWLHRR